jgi:hypothetical protein
LCKRHVDRVLYFDTYEVRHTDEAALLRQLAAGAPAAVTVTAGPGGSGWQSYMVDRSRCP